MSRKCSVHIFESSAVLENPFSYVEISQHEWGRDIKLHDKTTANFTTHETINSIQFECLFGIYDLPSGAHAAIVTESESYVSNKTPLINIRLAKKILLIPLYLKTKSLSAIKLNEDCICKNALQYVFKTHRFFYSPTGYDLTLTQQMSHKFESIKSDNIIPPWKRAERKFFWNYDVISDLMHIEAHSWITVFMSGFIEYKPDLEIDDTKFHLLFISRRSCFRQGCRFTRRGVDHLGNVANYVETEQTLIFPTGKLTSYVQVRGSIPITWKSTVSLKYDPEVVITPDKTAHTEEHFRLLSDSYCDKDSTIICVNLIDKKRDQQRLGIAFASAVDACRSKLVSGNIRYEWFDFHAETSKKGKWNNLSSLLISIEDDFKKVGYFTRHPNGEVSRQKGIIRTNCMDNLDRTNVTQSLFARRSLLMQLGKAESTISADKVLDSPFVKFEKIYKAVWAANADAISLMYAGTGALKVDFTKTGKRTMKGMFNDAVNSIYRYYINNFLDGVKQDAIDISLGKYKPSSIINFEQKQESPQSVIYRLYALLVFLFSISMVCSRIGLIRGTSPFSILLAVLLLVAVFCSYVFWVVFKFGSKIGEQLVVHPRISVDGL